MKKIIFVLFALSATVRSNAQLSLNVDFSDTSGYYSGIWTGNKLYSSKDSTAINSKSYFRIYTSRVQANALNYQNLTAGVPVYVLSADDSGIIKKYTLPIFAPTSDTLSASRAFNTSYQMSTTRYVEVKISASISCNLSLSGGAAGTIFLETSPDNVNWTQHGQMSSSNTGSLTIGLNTTQSGGSQVSALLPPNYFWRARTSSTTGTPTYTMFIGEKVTY